jgi:WD40 repeat protein
VAVVSHARVELALYDAATGHLRQQIPADACRAAAFSPDGRWLAFTVQDNVVLWDWPHRRQGRVLTEHVDTVTTLAFSPDSRTLASAGNGRQIKLWDTAAGQLLHTMTGNPGQMRDIAFAGNDCLISLDDQSNLHAWHTSLGELLCTLHCAPQNPAYHFTVSPDSHHVALPLDNGQVELLDISRR